MFLYHRTVGKYICKQVSKIHFYSSFKFFSDLYVQYSYRTYVKYLINLNRNSWRRQWKFYSHWSILRRLQPHSRCANGCFFLFLLPLLVDSAEARSDYKPIFVVLTDSIVSSYNYLWMKFVTDGTVHNRGFLLNYTTGTPPCTPLSN